MSRWLIIMGILLVVLGLAWPLIVKLGLGNLPGDIRVEREGLLSDHQRNHRLDRAVADPDAD